MQKRGLLSSAENFVRRFIFYHFYMINPITRVIVAYRDIFYYKQVPEFSNIILGLLESIIVLIIGLVVFRKLNKHFAEEL